MSQAMHVQTVATRDPAPEQLRAVVPTGDDPNRSGWVPLCSQISGCKFLVTRCLLNEILTKAMNNFTWAAKTATDLGI